MRIEGRRGRRWWSRDARRASRALRARRAPARRAPVRRIEGLEPRHMLAADLVITEIMASNGATLADADGDRPDWIEIHNRGTETVSLLGWSLTDDSGNPAKWRFPYRTVAPDGYLVVFASGKDRAAATADLTRDFHATPDGTFLIDLPDGDYDVYVSLGDAERLRDDVVVSLQGSPIATVETAAGEFTSVSARASVSDATGGQLAVTLEDDRGATRRAAINALIVSPRGGGTPRRFDFGTVDSPVETGFLPVTTDAFYSRQIGYGWRPGTVVSSRDRDVRAVELHTNFRLDAQGEQVALAAPDGTIVSRIPSGEGRFPEQRTDVSFGPTPDGPRYFAEPTPGAPNGLGQVGLVAATRFSHERGFYSAPFTLEITTSTPNAAIRYTLDGSDPSAEGGTRYDGPIVIDHTTTIRAAAFKADHVPGPIDTQTYLFLDDIVRQSPAGEAPEGWPAAPIRGQVFDYGMDPQIVDNPQWGPQMAAALTQIPSLSLVTDRAHLFDPASGIYVNAGRDGRDWERPASLELIEPDGGQQFQVDAGVRIRGGFSRGGFNPKHSFRLFFRNEYGAPQLDFPLFGDEGADRFDAIDLRTAQNYAWSNDTFNDQTRNTFLRDVFTRDLQREQGRPYTRSRYYHLYINGQYWGLYQTEERPEASYAATYFGGEKRNYDVIKASGGRLEATDGSLDPWRQLWTLAQAGFTTPEQYFFIQGRNADGTENPDLEVHVDIDQLIDFMINVFFTGNDDMPTSLGAGRVANNFWAIRDRTGRAGWQFIAHDNEHNMLSATADQTRDDPAGDTFGGFNPKYLHQQLDEFPEYQVRFADRVYRFFFGDGPMTTPRAQALLASRASQIDLAVIAESARWGDQHNEPPLTRDTWLDEVDWLMNDFLAGRREVVLGQLRAKGLYPDLEVPHFQQPPGTVPAGFELVIDNPQAEGTIYFTLDGTDPRAVGGAVSERARPYQGPLPIDRTTTVKSRVWHEGSWSALREATYRVDQARGIRITEINYHPHDAMRQFGELDLDNDQFEFIELQNRSDRPIDLTGLRLTEGSGDAQLPGLAFRFSDVPPEHATLRPGERVVVVRNRTAFESRYGAGRPIAGQFEGKLSNREGTILLLDAGGIELDRVDYRDRGAWPADADGTGSSLEFVPRSGGTHAPLDWQASILLGGTPGEPPAGTAGDVTINEVLSRGDGAASDQVELFNHTSRPIDLTGWSVTDDPDDLLQFRFPAGSVIAARRYLTVSADRLGFSLSADRGDALWLVATDPRTGRPSRFADRVHFGASGRRMTLGRWPESSGISQLVPFDTGTPGKRNVPPDAAEVVISEIHYHPAPASFFHRFADGPTEGFEPVSGNWNLVDGAYQGAPADGEDPLAVLTARPSLPTRFTVATTAQLPDQAEFFRNAMLVFDYRGPRDFKFASAHAGAGRWRIGRRDAQGWTFLTDWQAPVPTEATIELSVEIDGSLAIFRSGGLLRASYDFGKPLNDGQVGLATKNGLAQFHQFRVDAGEGETESEFIEISNATARTVDLAGWKLADAVEWTFPNGSTLAAGETLVVVPFDPDKDVLQAEAFRRRYAAESTLLVGPFAGRLNNAGEGVQLLRPVPIGGNEKIDLLEDLVPYRPIAPWPSAADGRGKSLQRSHPRAPGLVASSWQASDPTPGYRVDARRGDLNRDGNVDADDVEAVALALRSPDAYEAVFRVMGAFAGDVDGDGDLDFDDLASLAALLAGAP